MEQYKLIRVKIFGRVQLVMYRDFAMRKARKLGLVGTVRNLGDGSVEVIAEGKEDQLLFYLKHLQRGSVLSRVEKIEAEWGNPTHKFENFNIIYS